MLLKLFLFLQCCINTNVGFYDLFFHHLVHGPFGFSPASHLVGNFFLMKVNQTLNSAGSEPFVIWFLSDCCIVPLTLTIGSSCGSGGGNPVVPWRPTHIPSPPHCEPWYPLGSLEAIPTCDVTGAEAELSCVPAWWGALEGSLPHTGYPRKGLAGGSSVQLSRKSFLQRDLGDSDPCFL